jgi:hypothetical protein
MAIGALPQAAFKLQLISHGSLILWEFIRIRSFNFVQILIVPEPILLVSSKFPWVSRQQL